VLPPLRHLYFDPVVLAYLGENPSSAPCLTAFFDELRQGRADVISTKVSANIFAAEACGLRLYVVFSPDRFVAEITGYAYLRR
jgi:hypothetical protein